MPRIIQTVKHRGQLLHLIDSEAGRFIETVNYRLKSNAIKLFKLGEDLVAQTPTSLNFLQHPQQSNCAYLDVAEE